MAEGRTDSERNSLAITSDQDSVAGQSSKTSSRPYFTQAQAQCLRGFATDALGSGSAVHRISYHVVGSADLAERQTATAMLRALQSQDWVSASSHNAIAGATNLLLGILLHIDAEDGTSVDYWVAMRSPFEILDAPSLVACGKVDRPPQVSLVPLVAEAEK